MYFIDSSKPDAFSQSCDYVDMIVVESLKLIVMLCPPERPILVSEDNMDAGKHIPWVWTTASQ